jgi:hypothetical protein
MRGKRLFGGGHGHEARTVVKCIRRPYAMRGAYAVYFLVMAKKRHGGFNSVAEMMEMFRKTGARGGRKRAANMTKKQRSESARKAALARWSKQRKRG